MLNSNKLIKLFNVSFLFERSLSAYHHQLINLYWKALLAADSFYWDKPELHLKITDIFTR